MPNKTVSKPPRDPGGEASRVRDRFERLLSAGVAIFSEHALDGVLQQVVDSARDVVGARYAALGVLGPDRTSLSAFVTSGLTDHERQRIGDLPTGRGLLGLVIRDPKPIRSPDITAHPKRSGFPPHHPPMKSFLGVPILSRNEVFGNLYLTEKIGATEFNAEDEAIAVLLATHAAVAIESARVHDESQRLVGQIQEMQRQRDLFFAMMNHELRNALTGVYGWAERLVRGTPSPEKTARAAREVYESAEHTITLLNNFLDLTRLDARKLQPVWRELEVATALGRATASVGPSADGKRLALELECPAGIALRTDPVRLEQILVNLLRNAVQHSPDGGTIVVRVERADGAVRVSVVDQGPGIPPELQDRIFEPFERFDPQSGLGTGLGLPVSRRLAEVLGGRLTVASEPGRGATFTLALPLAPQAA